VEPRNTAALPVNVSAEEAPKPPRQAAEIVKLDKFRKK
jgi:hypothetical protein